MFLCIAKIWFYSIYFLFLLFLSFCSCLRMKEIEIEREWVREKQNTQISKRSFADWCFQDFVFVYTINSIWISLLFSKSILLDFVFLDLLLANLRMLFWFFFLLFCFWKCVYLCDFHFEIFTRRFNSCQSNCCYSFILLPYLPFDSRSVCLSFSELSIAIVFFMFLFLFVFYLGDSEFRRSFGKFR